MAMKAQPDPSRTQGLQRQARGIIARDWTAFRKQLKVRMAQPNLWPNSPELAVRGFDEWYITTTKELAVSQRWAAVVGQAFLQGMRRAAQDMRQSTSLTPGRREDPWPWDAGGQRLRSKVGLVTARLQSDLDGVVEQQGRRLSFALSEGLLKDADPTKAMQQIVGIFQRRAYGCVHDAVIRAHAEGQLEAFERAGVDEVTPLVEARLSLPPKMTPIKIGNEDVVNAAPVAKAKFRTAYGACPQCSKMNGRVFKVTEAHGLIPVHKNCRCVWLAWVGKRDDPAERVRLPRRNPVLA